MMILDHPQYKKKDKGADLKKNNRAELIIRDTRMATHSQFSCSSTHAWSLSQARARLCAVKLNG